jgi:hypothetical protein
MWALATLGLELGAELATAMSRQAVASAGEFKPQGVANLMWALAVISFEDQACCTIWADAISHLVTVLGRIPGHSPGLDGPANQAFYCQLHQVLLCMTLEGFLPGLDLAGQLGSDTVFRQTFEGTAVRSSKLQVREY